MRVILGTLVGLVGLLMLALLLLLVPQARKARTEQGRKRRVLRPPIMFTLGSRDDYTEEGWELRNAIVWVLVLGFGIVTVLLIALQVLGDAP